MGLPVIAPKNNIMFSKMGVKVVQPGQLDFQTANSNKQGMFIVYDEKLNADELSMIRKYANANPNASFVMVTDMADPHLNDRLEKITPTIWIDMRTDLFNLYNMLANHYETTQMEIQEMQILKMKDKMEMLQSEMDLLNRMLKELSDSNIRLTSESWKMKYDADQHSNGQNGQNGSSTT